MTPREVDAHSIQEKTTILIVNLNTLGNFRKVNTQELLGKEAKKMDAADLAKMIATNKRLFDSSELKAIACLDGDIRRYVNSVCLPSPFRTGTYALPKAMYPAVRQQMQVYGAERTVLVNKFLAKYDTLITEAKKRLDKVRKGLFNRTDYATKDEVAEKFGFTWQCVDVAPPDGTSKREAEMIAQQWRDIKHGMKIALREEAKALVDRMAETLAGRNDGKKKIFRNTLVTNVTKWLETFDPRNVPDDQELAKIAAKMRKLVDGVDPDTLREDDGARKAIATGFAEIGKQLNIMVVEKPKRGVNVN